MKHKDDEDWTIFTPEQAKAEKIRGADKVRKKSIILQSPENYGRSAIATVPPASQAAVDGSKNGFKTAKNTKPGTSTNGRNYNPAQRPVLARSVLEAAGNGTRAWTPAKRARRMGGEEKQMDTN